MRIGNVFEAQPPAEGGHSPNAKLVNAVVCMRRSSWALGGVPSPLWMPVSSSESTWGSTIHTSLLALTVDGSICQAVLDRPSTYERP